MYHLVRKYTVKTQPHSQGLSYSHSNFSSQDGEKMRDSGSKVGPGRGHISAQQESYSGAVLRYQVTTQPKLTNLCHLTLLTTVNKPQGLQIPQIHSEDLMSYMEKTLTGSFSHQVLIFHTDIHFYLNFPANCNSLLLTYQYIALW